MSITNSQSNEGGGAKEATPDATTSEPDASVGDLARNSTLLARAESLGPKIPNDAHGQNDGADQKQSTASPDLEAIGKKLSTTPPESGARKRLTTPPPDLQAIGKKLSTIPPEPDTGKEHTILANSGSSPSIPALSRAEKPTVDQDGGTASTAAPGLENQEIVHEFCQRCGNTLPVGGAACACDSGADDPLVGRTLEDRYEVIRRLGEGAMGAVYEVKHLRLNKPFAMKVIHTELTQVPEFVTRFEREAHSCSRLQHPNCISVTDFGRARSGELYLVMEFVRGNTLSELIRDRPFPVGRALEITRQVLLGLQHAHQAGVIHRDIKPDNIMQVDSDRIGGWQVKILDFGIAKGPVKENKGKQLTQAGVIFGTPEYMAPEQAMSAAVDERADLYAVGVTLWRMLTGRHLFEDEEEPIEILTAKLSKTAPSLDSVTPGVYSDSLREFVRRSLERKPADRFASAEEMLVELERIQNELGRGLAVTPRASVLRSLVARAKTLPRLARDTVLDWYDCEALQEEPTWTARARGLVTTRPGLTVLSAGAALLALLIIIPAVIFSGPDDAPGGPPAGLPAKDSWADRVFKKTVIPKPPETRELPKKIQAQLLKARMFLGENKACREAMLEMKGLLMEEPRLPQAHHLLGAAEICRRSYRAGLRSYATAIDIDPRLRKDIRIHMDARRLLKVKAVRIDTLKFLGTKVGKPALDIIAEVANTHRDLKMRSYAAKLLVWHKAANRIKPLSKLSLDLRQLTSCKERAAVVARLRALGEPDAIPILRKALKQRGKARFFRKARLKNYCIRKELREAINHLKGGGGK